MTFVVNFLFSLYLFTSPTGPVHSIPELTPRKNSAPLLPLSSLLMKVVVNQKSPAMRLLYARVRIPGASSCIVYALPQTACAARTARVEIVTTTASSQNIETLLLQLCLSATQQLSNPKLTKARSTTKAVLVGNPVASSATANASTLVCCVPTSASALHVRTLKGVPIWLAVSPQA